MLKYILFLLSGYYYETVWERKTEIEKNITGYAPWVGIRYEKIVKDVFDIKREELPGQESLIVTDLPWLAGQCLERGWYVAALYHERNRGAGFPAVRYGIEDVFALEYRSYEEAYRRLAGLPWDILETKRLKVRESTLSDVEDFYRIYTEPSITRYMEDLFPQKEAELAYMKAYIDQIYGFYGYGLWTVVLKENGRVIGRAGLSVREGYELPELGFVIEAAYQRQGYGLEVCGAILKYAGEELFFEKVQALVKEENLVSKSLLARLGFIFEKRVLEKGEEYELHTVALQKAEQYLKEIKIL